VGIKGLLCFPCRYRFDLQGGEKYLLNVAEWNRQYRDSWCAHQPSNIVDKYPSQWDMFKYYSDESARLSRVSATLLSWLAFGGIIVALFLPSNGFAVVVTAWLFAYAACRNRTLRAKQIAMSFSCPCPPVPDRYAISGTPELVMVDQDSLPGSANERGDLDGTALRAYDPRLLPSEYTIGETLYFDEVRAAGEGPSIVHAYGKVERVVTDAEVAHLVVSFLDGRNDVRIRQETRRFLLGEPSHFRGPTAPPPDADERYPIDWWTRRERALKRDGHRCRLCGSTSVLHVHHVVPISKGGSDSLRNLITLCSACHMEQRYFHHDDLVRQARERKAHL
jgi:hypothetical protein